MIAAGAVVIARTTGRTLFALRSNDVSKGGVWAFFGGKVESGEKPSEAALRELAEESGYDGPVERVTPLLTFKNRLITFHNNLVIVPHEFKTRLNWENTDSRWAKRFPQPLHPGVVALLADKQSVKTIRSALTRMGVS